MARYVEQGILDAGITGHDWVVETQADVTEVAAAYDAAGLETRYFNPEIFAAAFALPLSADDHADQATAYAEEQEMDVRRELLAAAMDTLNEREAHILTERRLKDDPVTLEDLSKVYDVSRERIRQIEVRAFEKLQKAMKSMATEQGLMH